MSRSTLTLAMRGWVEKLLSLARITDFRQSNFTVLTFHRILPEDLRRKYPLPGLVISPSELTWLIDQLQPHFNIFPVSKAYEVFGEAVSQKPVLAITFDDGQYDNFKFAAPVLSRAKIFGTFYIPTGQIETSELLWHDLAGFSFLQRNLECKEVLAGLPIENADLSPLVEESPWHFVNNLKNLDSTQRHQVLKELEITAKGFPEWARLMNWSEVRALSRDGHEIGSHSISHSLLDQLSLSEQAHELMGSGMEIENQTGICPISFCYPNGNYNADTLKLLNQSRYVNAVTTEWGTNGIETEPYNIKRIDITSRAIRGSQGDLCLDRLKFTMSKLKTII